MMGDSFQKKIMDDLTTRRLLLPSLQSQDIDFLALSETKFELKVKKPQVVVKRERGERLERSKQRIKDELGINIF
jgi:predicted membrane GTPase involved in stress response